MKKYHPRSWLQAIPPSAPCDHMIESPSGTYVEAQEARERIDNLVAENRAWRATLAQLLVAAENYTRNHDLHGDDAIITGRCWDKMRRSMDAAAQTLDGLEVADG